MYNQRWLQFIAKNKIDVNRIKSSRFFFIVLICFMVSNAQTAMAMAATSDTANRNFNMSTKIYDRMQNYVDAKIGQPNAINTGPVSIEVKRCVTRIMYKILWSHEFDLIFMFRQSNEI